MRIVLQRVTQAKVISDGVLTGEIGKGLVLLLGIEKEDTINDIIWLVRKVTQMRIFSDEQGKMNLSVKDLEAEILVVSQFTLFASTKKGNRPSFLNAAPPSTAIPLYEKFLQAIREAGFNVQSGVFGADMQIELINDGPVTILLDSKNPE